MTFGAVVVVSRELQGHIEVLSLPFTSGMPMWKLQSESLHWYQK